MNVLFLLDSLLIGLCQIQFLKERKFYHFLLMLDKTSWKTVLGGIICVVEFGGFACLNIWGEREDFFLMLYFFHIGLEFSWEDCLPLDPHLCPHPQGDTLGCTPILPSNLNTLENLTVPWPKTSGCFQDLKRQEGCYDHCVKETRWEDKHILCRS